MDLRFVARRLGGLPRPWIPRRSCLRSQCRHASSAPGEKPYYVTTPIFYVNASPHIGHMYSLLLADVLKRWQTLQGRRALLCTGTDEHGMKVERAAALQDVPPKQFCDTNAAMFKDLAQKSGIDNDFFIRTTDADHVEAVKHFWFLLQDKGYIYQSKHSGWYSVVDEAYYPDHMVRNGFDPQTGRVHTVSTETGSEVDWTEEKNYRFRMTDLKEKLLEHYRSNPDWIQPVAKMNEVVNWVENNLEDLSISRSTSRLGWGIPVPDDPSQVIYVWVDALINYITKAGFPGWTPGLEHEGGWPADVQIMGKDIIRFHAVYWPALLLALGLPLPKRILCHGHWTLSGRKMSKSAGNAVNPFFAMDRFGVDAMRFFLIHQGGIGRDADYDNAHIVVRYKEALQSGLGNLLGRITRAKLWNVREAVEAAQKGDVAAAQDDFLEKYGIGQLAQSVSERMDRLEPGAALELIRQSAVNVDKYIHASAPWTLAKSDDPESKAKLHQIIYNASEALRIIGILLQPFIPTKAGELLDVLGVPETNRKFEHAHFGGDFEYGVAKSDPKINLFPPLVLEV